MNVDVRALIGLNTAGAWIIAALYLSSATAIALTGDSGWELRPNTVAALVVTAAATLTLLMVRADPVPVAPTLALAASIPVACALALSDMPDRNGTWILSAGTVTASFLCLRGRVGASWLAAGAVVAVCAVWSQMQGHGPTYGLSLALGQLVPVVSASFFASTVRPAMYRIASLHEAAQRKAVAHALALAELEERRYQFARIDPLVRPLLEKVAGPDALDESVATEARVTEALLRDRVGAPALATEAVTTAAGNARRRGVQVSLADSGGFDQVPEDIRERVLARVVAELETTTATTVAIRILPAGRPHLVTLLIRDSQGSRHQRIDHQGKIVSDDTIPSAPDPS